MDWISVEDRLPQISYLESNNAEYPYECYPVLVFCPQEPGIFCVAYLEMNQDEDSWNHEELFWQLYFPSEGGGIENLHFEVFTHWMPLPKAPEH